MTNEKINIAIAEACGWTFINQVDKHPHGLPPDGRKDRYTSPLPDYCNDLNAMHKAEATLDFEQAELFEDELCDVTFKNNDGLENPLPCRFSVCHATSRQRAEAFLKAIGKWKETNHDH
jgi:hypothetical protein